MTREPSLWDLQRAENPGHSKWYIERFRAMAARYPDIRTDQYHIDILTANFVLHPDWFDVVVGSNLFGDILTDEYCIEAKFHKSLTDGQLDKFWLKIVAEAEENKRQPVLIYKENRKRPIVMFFDYLRGTRRVLMFYDEWLEFLKEQQDAKNVSYPKYDPVAEAQRFT